MFYMLNNFIAILYKKLFNFTFDNNKLYYRNVIISNNIKTILTFLGLCYTQYKRIKTNEDIIKFISGSHFFNIDYYNLKNITIRRQFDYKSYIHKKIKDINYINEEHKIYLILYKDNYYINLHNYELIKQFYNFDIFIEDNSIKIDKVLEFFKKYN